MSQTLRSTHLPASPGLQEKTGGQFSDNLKDSFFFSLMWAILKSLLNLLQYSLCFGFLAY